MWTAVGVTSRRRRTGTKGTVNPPRVALAVFAVNTTHAGAISAAASAVGEALTRRPRHTKGVETEALATLTHATSATEPITRAWQRGVATWWSKALANLLQSSSIVESTVKCVNGALHVHFPHYICQSHPVLTSQEPWDEQSFGQVNGQSQSWINSTWL